MPEMEGIATIKALHALGCKLPPIVALTANNYDALIKEAGQKGRSWEWLKGKLLAIV